MSIAYRSVRLKCKHAGGSQNLAPTVVAMVRDVQQLENNTVLELLDATETYLQQVQSTGLSIQTIVDEWIADARPIQKDILEEFVTHVFPKMMDDVRANTQSLQSWQQQQQAAAKAVVKAWQQHALVTSSEEAWKQTVGETMSTQTQGPPGLPQAPGPTTALVNTSITAVMHATVMNQKLAKKNLGLRQKYQELVKRTAEQMKTVKQQHLEQMQNSATASSSTVSIVRPTSQDRFGKEWIAFQDARRAEQRAFKKERPGQKRLREPERQVQNLERQFPVRLPEPQEFPEELQEAAI